MFSGGGQTSLSSLIGVWSSNKISPILLQYRKIGFTLAEVLITLGIIGIVAAMTMPVLINKYRKIVIANQFKKNYAVFQTVLQKGMSDYGAFGEWPCFYDIWGRFNVYPDKFTEIIAESLKTAHKKSGSQTGWKNFAMCDANTSYIAMDGNVLKAGTLDPSWEKEATFYLPDGSCWYFKTIDDDSYRDHPLSYMAKNSGNNPMMEMYIDVNSSKNGPNILGIDLFVFWINYNGKISLYKNYDPNNCSTKPGKNYGGGYSCTGRLIQDGFVFKEDYPWSFSRKGK